MATLIEFKTIKAKELSDAEQYKFTEAFYEQWEFAKDDLEDELPLGCPWLFTLEIFLEGDSIEEMAKNWYKECYSDILTTFEHYLGY